MISKVKLVQGVGTFDSRHGLMYSYEYEMEDGTILKANHKTTPAPFKSGDTVEYTITKEHPQYGKSGTVGKPKEMPTTEQNNGSSQPVSADVWRKKDIAIIYQNALTQANQIMANFGSGLDEAHALNKLKEMADDIAQFVIKKSGI